jgi:hypothetical protein
MSRQILVTGAEERVRAVAEALSAAGCDCVTATDAPALTAVVDELGDRRLDAYVQLPVTIGSAATTAIGRIRDLLTQGLIARFDAAAAVIGAMADGGNVILVAGNTPGHREHNDDQRARHALLRVLSHSILADSAGRSIRSTVLPGESTPAQIVATLEGHAASREQVIGEFVERDSDLSYADWRVELLSLVAHES